MRKHKLKLLQFNPRPAHTLLFITEIKTFRVDADRHGILRGPLQVIEQGCKSSGQLGKAFGKIADNTPRLGRKVWLLFLRLPALLLSLPTLQVKGMDDATLTQALQFEAEGLTGVSSLESRVAFRFLRAENDMSDYWLVQIEQLAWDDLLNAVKRRNCKLAGLLHPGGLPLALHKPEAEEWLRIEAWSSQLVALQRNEERLAALVLGFDNPHWQAELEHWLHEHGEVEASETLLNNRVEFLPPTRSQFVLSETGQLEQWLALWAQVLIAGQAAEAALLQPLANIDPELAWMAGTGLGAILLCGLHAGWFVYHQAYFERETARLTQVDKAMADLRGQITASTDQRDRLEAKLKKAAADAELIPNTVKTLQQRPALLLKALADGRHPRLIVETMDSQLNDVTVGGVSLQQHLSNQLAAYLQERLVGSNWRVGAATKENMALFDGEPGPWSFKLVVSDQGIAGFGEVKK
ncbi:hypothetical protein IVG45_11325 [Methylomonas sp. LL1]|uniref:hypothetical protein n=1 Tax=Methylomonas sp. LL1 TaxID=2785785 RepID=UPI0018C35EE5|nr:hypothetical protein [Methylomonas sp. LL1]QPK61496.1 hypothetical protein IVG45_11325 [Methylomonas sp. LL1]